MKTKLEQYENYIKIANLNGTTWREEFEVDNGKIMLVRIAKKVEGLYIVPEFVDSIESYAAHRNNGLIAVKTYSNLKGIGISAFESCRNLETIELVDGLRVIGQNAFSLCNSLKELIIPDTVTKITGRLIDEFNAVQKFKLSRNIESVGNHSANVIAKIPEVYMTKRHARQIGDLRGLDNIHFI